MKGIRAGRQTVVPGNLRANLLLLIAEERLQRSLDEVTWTPAVCDSI